MSGVLSEGRKSIEVQVVTRQRANKIRRVWFHHGVQSVRVFNVLFGEIVIIIADGNIESAVRDQSPLIEGILIRMAQ